MMIWIKNFGGIYYFDLERYIDFIANVTSAERPSNSVITETYSEDAQNEEDEMTMVTKEIVETKGNGGGNEFFHETRYKIISDLVNFLLYYTSDGEVYDDNETLSMGQKLAFNTLIKYGILKKKEEE